jgi:predicted signal transduction protein with EAL and GGDEF domain
MGKVEKSATLHYREMYRPVNPNNFVFLDYTRTSTQSSKSDEFVVLAPNATEQELLNIAKNIHRNIKSVECFLNGVEFPQITLSMGLALFPIHGLTGDGLMFQADSHLFQAKESGKDRIVFQ